MDILFQIGMWLFTAVLILGFCYLILRYLVEEPEEFWGTVLAIVVCVTLFGFMAVWVDWAQAGVHKLFGGIN